MNAIPTSFGPDAVRAILDGRKTQFRECMPDGKAPPLHAPGDLIFVRESFAAYWGPRHEGGRVVFDADVRQTDGRIVRATRDDPVHVFYEADAKAAGPTDWHPAGTMQEWASRLTLRVVSSRAERLKSLTEADAEASGPEFEIWDMALAVRDYSKPDRAWFHMWSTHEGEPAYVPEDRIWRASYRTLWERTHGAGSWDANPLVGVTAFEVVKAPS